MTNQGAGVRAAIVGNGAAAVLGDHVDVKIDHTFARDARRLRSHAVGGMAS